MAPPIFCKLNHDKDKSRRKHKAWFDIFFSQDGFIVLIPWITDLFNLSEVKKINTTVIDGDIAQQIRYCGWSTTGNALVSYSFIICGMFFCPVLRRLKYIGGNMFVQEWNNSIQSHHQLQYALDVGLLKYVSLWRVSTLARFAKVTRALTGRRPVRTAADDDFEITQYSLCCCFKWDGIALSTLFCIQVFVYKCNIYYVPSVGENVTKFFQITNDGVPKKIFNGVPDWVYEGNLDFWN